MIKRWGPKASLFLFPAECPEQYAEEEQQRQCGMCQRGGYFACKQRKRGDSAFRTALQERKQGVKKERAESGVAELCKAVILLGKGHAGKYAEGLPEYGKPAKGNEKGGGSQACVERVTGSAQKVCAVCHFQQAGADSLQKTGGNRQEGKQTGKQAEKP